MNEGFGKDFYGKCNSVKRSGPFSEPPDSENWKVAVLIPFLNISSSNMIEQWTLLEKCRWDIFKLQERGFNIFRHVSDRFRIFFAFFETFFASNLFPSIVWKSLWQMGHYAQKQVRDTFRNVLCNYLFSHFEPKALHNSAPRMTGRRSHWTERGDDNIFCVWRLWCACSFSGCE